MLDIHVDTRLCYTADGWAERTEVYVQIYQSLIETGLLAQLNGNQLKVFLGLTLQATILTPGDFFTHLRSQGLATEADLGRIICYQSQQTLGQQCGLHPETVGTCLAVLEHAHHLVTRRLTQGRDGRYSRPLFLIQATAFVSPPRAQRTAPPAAALTPPGPSATTGIVHRAENSATGIPHPSEISATVAAHRAEKTVAETSYRDGFSAAEIPQAGCRVAVVGNPLALESSTTPLQPALENSDTVAAQVCAAFAAARGAPYALTPRDHALLAELHAAGYSLAAILTGVQTAVSGALQRGEFPRTLAYCAPAIRATRLPPAPTSPPLPADLCQDLQSLGWQGSTALIAQRYAAHPTAVRARLTHWLEQPPAGVREPAALFRRELQEGTLLLSPAPAAPPPAPPPLTDAPGAAALWQHTLTLLRQQMARATFDTWLGNTQGLGYAKGDLVIGVPDAHTGDWLAQQLQRPITRALYQVAARELAFVCAVPEVAHA